MKRLFLMLATSGMIGSFLYFCPMSHWAPKSGLAAGAAPSFSLADSAGKTVSLSDYKGKVVLVSFWATWCDSCQEEMPALESLYRRYRSSGFSVLAPSVDQEGRKAIIPFAERFGLSFPLLIADVNTAKAYRISGLPTSYLLDSGGRIARKYSGPVESAKLENDILEQLKLRRPS